jgi:hypothetical protein
VSVKSIAVAVQSVVELERVIEQVARQSTSALVVLPDLFNATNRQSIIALATRQLRGNPDVEQTSPNDRV